MILGCFDKDFAYRGNDLGEKRKKKILADTPEDCQKLCEETDDCNVFTFRASEKGCWLKQIDIETSKKS